MLLLVTSGSLLSYLIRVQLVLSLCLCLASGSIPAWIGSLPSLFKLDLHDNDLEGNDVYTSLVVH